MLLLSCVLEQVLLELDLNRVGVGPAHVHDLLDGQGTVGVLCQPPDVYERRLVLMVTYSDLFQFVIMLCAVITLVVLFIRKK